jgi:hypothetical protein
MRYLRLQLQPTYELQLFSQPVPESQSQDRQRPCSCLSATVDPAALWLVCVCACAVSDAFMRLLSNPYDLSEKVLPNDYSIARAGLRPEVRGL